MKLPYLCASALLAFATPLVLAAPSSAPTGSLAAWTGHAFIVDLDDLPRVYSCQDLWYKFRGVLIAIGARSDMSVTPYACQGRSPRVQLQFLMPNPVTGAQARFADLRTTERAIQIAPGQPGVLKDDDCQLIEMMKDELLNRLPVRIQSDHFVCTPPAGSHEEYSVSLRAQMPVDTTATTRAAANGAPSVPSASATKPHG